MLFDEAFKNVAPHVLRMGVLSGCFLTVLPLWSQRDSTGSRPAFQFGFLVGADYCLLAPWQWTEDAMPPTYRDSISSVATVPRTGFSFGLLYERSIRKDLSLRVLPTFGFLAGSMDYHYPDRTVERVSLERTEIGLTVQPLYCARVRGKVRPYMAFGASVGYCPDKDSSLERVAFRLDFGGGVRFPIAGAQCGVEMRAGKSLNDLLVRQGTHYTEVLERLEWNAFSLRIVFQG